MNDWEQSLTTTRLDFIDALEQRGFNRVDGEDVWRGVVLPGSGSRRRIGIGLHDAWPYHPPIVLPLDPTVGRSWHLDPAGALCLYVEADRETLPWLSADELFSRIIGWFDQADNGWPDDTPDLDLERYFEVANPRHTVLYDELHNQIDRAVRLRRGTNRTLLLTSHNIPPRKRQRWKHVNGYVADLGSPDTPPTDWESLLPLLSDGAVVEDKIRKGLINLLLLRYERGGHEGVIALGCRVDEKQIVLRAHHAASTGPAVRRLRAGRQQQALADAHVVLIGCGAIGSFVADGLLRAGLGTLELRDHDILRPGNLIRHLAGDAEVGLPKPEAVKQVLRQTPYAEATLTTVNAGLIDPREAGELVTAFDLVIDATADGSVTALLRAAAEAHGKTVLTVCTQNDGETVRVDVMPPLNGQHPLPATPQRPSQTPDVYEGGCGSPVSPTPPHNVIEAAALTVRHACGLLLGKPLSDVGEVRDYPRNEP